MPRKLKVAIGAVLVATCIIAITSPVWLSPKRMLNLASPNKQIMRSHTAKAKNDSAFLLDLIRDENSLVLQGSSELSALSGTMFHPGSQYNYEDKNIIISGQGYIQSLQHGLNLSALSQSQPLKKCALIASIQWFTPAGITADRGAQFFSNNSLIATLENPKLSAELKERIISRVTELYGETPVVKDQIDLAVKAYRNTLNPIEIAGYSLRRLNDTNSHLFTYLWENRAELQKKTTPQYVSASSFDWQALLKEAETEGTSKCTNNPYCVADDYFETYIKDSYASYKNSETATVYDNSPEFNDLKLYLDIAAAMETEIALFLIPTNGLWSDYTGLPPAMIDSYFAKVVGLAKEYPNVTIYNHREHSYEPYYFKDIMHLGWKGWVYVQKDLHDFQMR